MSKVGVVVSARMASRRLPGKAMLDLCGKPMLEWIMGRLEGSRLASRIVFATTTRPDDDVLADRISSLGIGVFRGADADVAGRYLEAARHFGFDWIVRVTGDCPFVDAASLDHCLAQWPDVDEPVLLSTKGVFPVGIDYEMFSTKLLEREWPGMDDKEREHLTLRFYRADTGIKVRRFSAPPAWPTVSRSYVVDTPSDYAVALRRVKALGCGGFSIQQLLELGDE